MDINANSRFSYNPQVNIDRSRIQETHSFKFTGSAGKLIPCFYTDVMPGDTLSLDMSALVRMATPIFPIMDNCYLDVYFFHIPNRIVWTHWNEFMGENNDGIWTQPIEYTVPQLEFPFAQIEAEEEGMPPSYVGGYSNYSIADYFALPVNVGRVDNMDATEHTTISALPFRGLAMIYNEWFRDQNTMMPYFVPTDDATRTGVRKENGTAYTDVNSVALGGACPPVARFFDYFSSCLPQPQKGNDVEVTLAQGLLPVRTTQLDNLFDDNTEYALRFKRTNNDSGYDYAGDLAVNDGDLVGFDNIPDFTGSFSLTPVNLSADAAGLSVISINELRSAFQIQKILEKDAMGGSRYREIIYTHFGVITPDSRMQIPEYLGGKRIPINISQVVQTSETQNTPQGNVSAFSLTSDVDSYFTKSFTEHGMVIGVCCVRVHHSYQQGLERKWSRKRRFDYYFPALAHIGNQPVFRKELYCTSYLSNDDEVFGYNEAWSDYRYMPSKIAGSFRSNAPNGSLDSWHYADYYDSAPMLNQEWMSESPVNVARTLAVQDNVDDQFLFDFYFKADFVRPMPLYSIPGLIDHF